MPLTDRLLPDQCGELHTLPSAFKEADIRLLCGSILPYEIRAFHKAVTACGSLSVTKIGLCVPKEFPDYCISLFGEDIQIAETSYGLFGNSVNGKIYFPLTQQYIVRNSLPTFKNLTDKTMPVAQNDCGDTLHGFDGG